MSIGNPSVREVLGCGVDNNGNTTPIRVVGGIIQGGLGGGNGTSLQNGLSPAPAILMCGLDPSGNLTAVGVRGRVVQT